MSLGRKTKYLRIYFDEEKKILSFLKPINEFSDPELREKYGDIYPFRIYLPLENKVALLIDIGSSDFGKSLYEGLLKICEEREQCDGFFTAFNEKGEPIEILVVVSKENYLKIIKWIISKCDFGRRIG